MPRAAIIAQTTPATSHTQSQGSAVRPKNGCNHSSTPAYPAYTPVQRSVQPHPARQRHPDEAPRAATHPSIANPKYKQKCTTLSLTSAGPGRCGGFGQWVAANSPIQYAIQTRRSRGRCSLGTGDAMPCHTTRVDGRATATPSRASPATGTASPHAPAGSPAARASTAADKPGPPRRSSADTTGTSRRTTNRRETGIDAVPPPEHHHPASPPPATCAAAEPSPLPADAPPDAAAAVTAASAAPPPRGSVSAATRASTIGAAGVRAGAPTGGITPAPK